MDETKYTEVSQNETAESVETVDEEKQAKFFEESKERMSKICQQIGYLEKIANKRSIDYTKENVEKMFCYLEQQLAGAKKTFMTRFEETEKTKNFDFDF